MNILSVIPARGGSKGLPGKNVRMLAGKPLIAWTIAAARAARVPIADIVVSTDDPAIRDASIAAGASVPFWRPADLALDETPTTPVLQHAVTEMEARGGGPYDWILLLQPTSPLRRAEDIDAVVALAESDPSGCDSVISVVERPGEHPRLAKYMENGLLRPFLGESLEGVRRQDCQPPALFNNGAIYLTRRDVLMDGGEILGRRARAYVMPKERSLDIDDAQDLALAELMMKRSENPTDLGAA